MLLTVLIFSCLSSILINFIIQRKFLSNGLVDKINHRSSHEVIATRSGGVSIFILVFLISSYNYIIGFTLFDYSLIIPLILLLSIGLYDDIYNIDYKLKFIFQIIAAKLIIDSGLIIDNFHGLFNIYEINRILAQVLTIFAIVAIINSINFIDGIDGLAIVVISIFIIIFENSVLTPTPFIYLSFILLGSFIPNLVYNLKPQNKVFLGDSGSLFLGGVVSIYILHILSNKYIINPDLDINKILFVISILVYPIVDIIRVFFLRLRKGKSPFLADKNHIHHIILKKTKNHFTTTLLISCLTIFIVLLFQLIF
tara:strand:- start:571 stop:1503 length:933 start_codon:yes stop_codon:yes gene_type:complete